MKEVKRNILKCFTLCGLLTVFLLSFQLVTVSAETTGNTYGFFVSGISGGAGNSTDISIGKVQSTLKNNRLKNYAGQKKFKELRYNSEKNGISKSEFKKRIRDAYRNTTKDDLSIFFYNGHGSKNGINLAINKNIEFTYEELAKIIVKSSKSSRILVVMDSCYSTNFYDKGLSKLSQNQRERFIAYLSTESDDTAEYFGGMARFTKAFTEGIGYSGKCYADFDKNGNITVYELEKYIDVQMKDDLLDSDIVNWSDQQLFVYAKDKNFVVYSEAILKLNKEKAEVWKSGFLQLKAEKKNIDSVLKWETSNPKIATVDKNGKVCGIGAGSVVISVKGGGRSSKCMVTVRTPSVKLNKTKLELLLGKNKSYRLKATVSGPSKSVVWTSSNKRVAAVSSKGKVTAKREGTAIITAKANGISTKCKVTVNNKTIYNAYQKLVLKKDRYGNYIYPTYYCMDINNDRIPELLLLTDFKYSKEYLGISGYKVYTYKNGKAVHLGDAEGGISVRILKNKKGIVCSCADVIGVYKWKNGKLYRTERYIWGFSEKEREQWFKGWQKFKSEEAEKRYMPWKPIIKKQSESRNEHLRRVLRAQGF